MKKNILVIFSLIFLTQAISLVGFLHPSIRQIAFIVICLGALILTIKDLRWGIFILFAELFIGSKGYLFYFSFGNHPISIRIALWGIVMAVWAVKAIKNYELKITNYRGRLFFCFFAFLFFLILGVANAFFHHNSLNNIYSDFNNWLYLLTIFPLLSAIKSREDWQRIWQIFLASTLWLGFETLVLFFIFSHDLPQTASVLYSWIRNTLVGEITFVQYGFFRIFIQSQIFNLLGFFIILPMLIEKQKDRKHFIIHYSLFIIQFAVVLVSMSRSFWLGLGGGLLFLGFYFLAKKEWRKFFKLILVFFSASFLSLILILGILKFPYPAPLSGASLELFKNRALQISGESAVSSRWNLLPVIWSEIKQAPILGHGWGKTITYKSLDPRVLEKNPSGEYTTFAFEWGWLDFALKIGLLGVLAYFIFLAKIFLAWLKNQADDFSGQLALGLAVSLLVLGIVHFFTPYLGHPLGIGFIVLLAGYLIGLKNATN